MRDADRARLAKAKKDYEDASVRYYEFVGKSPSKVKPEPMQKAWDKYLRLLKLYNQPIGKPTKGGTNDNHR